MGEVEVAWYDAWMPKNEWHKEAIVKWVHKEFPGVRGTFEDTVASGGVVNKTFHFFCIDGLMQTTADWIKTTLGSHDEAMSMFDQYDGRSRALVLEQRFAGSCAESAWYKMWLPITGWHEDALAEWVEREIVALQGSAEAA